MNNLQNWIQSNCRFASKRRTAFVVPLRLNKGEIEMLVAKRKSEPHAGEWSLPGGRIEDEETVQDGARRELKEETDLPAYEITEIDVENQSDRKRSIFMAAIDPKEKATAGSDISDVKWVSIDKIPDLAFDDNEYIDKAVKAFKRREKKAQQLDKGILIVFEGIDGSGKTSQTDWLIEWLEKQDYPIVHTKWNSSEDIAPATRALKDKKQLSPTLFSLMHAADMLWRWDNIVKPALDKGRIVICDRYYYTSYVRDKIRGVNTEILDEIYADLKEPDIVFHLTVSPELAYSRVLDEKGLTWYGSGMDLELSENKADSCLKYEQMMDKEYREQMPRLAKNYIRFNTSRSEKEIFKDVKAELKTRFGIGDHDE